MTQIKVASADHIYTVLMVRRDARADRRCRCPWKSTPTRESPSSEGPDRIFPRSKAIIGRKVQHCHPPKSVDVVERILSDFRDGRHNKAEFWINFHGKFVHIRYFALREETGQYVGCLEVTQDLTALRALEGERRLLEYEA